MSRLGHFATGAGKQYHGTDVELEPGQKVLPRSVTGVRANAFGNRDTSQHVGTTAHLPEAARYGKHVYVVEPVNPRPDPEYTGAAHRIHPQAAHGTFDADEAVVQRRVSPEAVSRASEFRALRRRDGEPVPERQGSNRWADAYERQRAMDRARRKRR